MTKKKAKQLLKHIANGFFRKKPAPKSQGSRADEAVLTEDNTTDSEVKNDVAHSASCFTCKKFNECKGGEDSFTFSVECYEIDTDMKHYAVRMWSKGYMAGMKAMQYTKGIHYPEGSKQASDEVTSCKAVAPGGSTPQQYGLPDKVSELQDLIEHRQMNFAVGNIFKACYRLGICPHSDTKRDLRKIIWFARRELNRIKQDS